MQQLKRQRQFEKLSLGLALAVLVVLTLGLREDSAAFHETMDAINLSRSVLRAAVTVLTDLTDAETGQRGFLLTGRPEYLEPYTHGTGSIRPDMAKLIEMERKRPDISPQIARLSSLCDVKLAHMERTIELRRTQGFDAAVALVNEGTGRQSMDELREIVRNLRAAEEARLGVVLAASERHSWRVRVASIAIQGVLFSLLFISIYTGHRGVRRRERLMESVAVERGRTGEARDLLRTTLSSIGDAVMVTDAERRITFLNPVAESLTGWTMAEATGRPVDDVIVLLDSNSREPLEGPVSGVLRSGSMVGASERALLLGRDGREIPVDERGAPIRDPAGNVMGVVLVFRDVTERRSSERERERLLADAQAARADAEIERAHLFSLFLQAPAIINVFSGPDHVFSFLHPLMEPWAGDLDVLGRDARKALPELAEQGLFDPLDVVYGTGQPNQLHEFRVRHGAAGAPAGPQFDRYFDIIYKPWRDRAGETAGVMMFAVEVTGQVRARRELEQTQERLRETAKLESLGVLAGGVAHDFNNLLTGIMGNASLAAEMAPPNSSQARMLSEVLSASDRAANLTRQMLAYSGQGRFVVAPLDLSRAVSEISALVQSSIPRTVRTELALGEGLPPVEADVTQVQQLIMNLVINAAEAYLGRTGTVTVSTALERLDATQAARLRASGGSLAVGEYVTLRVTDDGCGMDEALLARIFDPFFTTKFTGRGLGLSAALGIIRAHRGAITVNTAPGAGTTFTVYLPASSKALAVVAAAAPDDNAQEPRTGTILVVDDESSVRRMAATALEQSGYRVIEAEHGGLALDTLREEAQQVSLVLLDLTMPVMSGEETLHRIHALWPSIPVLLSSGFDETAALNSVETLSVAGFLQKPYTASGLIRKVNETLDSQPLKSARKGAGR